MDMWRKAGAFLAAILLVIFASFCTLATARAESAPPKKSASAVLAKTAIKPYVLGPQDSLRLTVYDWRSATDTLFEWKALNGVFTINNEGKILLPLVGEVEARGQTIKKLARLISDQMTRILKLGTPLQVGIEIKKYRPFYILGRVARPGEYAYRPALTVLQALSIAGGLPRSQSASLFQQEKSKIVSRGNVQQLQQQYFALLARKARLQAELFNSARLKFPAFLESKRRTSGIRRIMDQEGIIFKTRKKARSVQVKILLQLKSFLSRELKSLEKQMVLKQKEYAIALKERRSTLSLVKRKLTVKDRQLVSDRYVTQASGQLLATETSLLRVRKEISRTDISVLEVRNELESEVSVQLRETQNELVQVKSKLETAKQVLREDQAMTMGLPAASQGKARKKQLRFSILRLENGKATRMSADEATRVEPGDTLKVTIGIIK